MNAIDPALFAGIAPTGRAANPTDGRVRRARAGSLAALVVLTWTWHLRATGTFSLSAFALLATWVLIWLAFGRLFVRATAGIVAWQAGIAYELLAGFLVANTLLFVLTLVSPLGIGVHVALLGVAALVLALPRRLREPAQGRKLQPELGSVACIVFSGLAATLWVGDQQPVMAIRDGVAVFSVWSDVFIHAREISAFAQSHDLQSLSDIKLARVPAAVYHFASYMVPASLNALTPTSALDSYTAFQLPFGILLAGMAAYAMTALLFRTTWPAVLAAAALLALPDAYQQVFGIRYLSFHFMTQVNLGMLYGLACISIAWVFMIEACHRERIAGLVIAYGLLAVCLTYKAHLFVANALILMLYPCAYFGRFRWWWRVLVAAALIALFAAVVSISQMSPRVPVLRLDGSGLAEYVDILKWGFADGALKNLWLWAYYGHHYPRVVNGVLAASLILVASFGIWTLAAPIVLWRNRRVLEPRTVSFVLLIVVNYMVMSTLLALDDRGVGSREEFLNRPHAWAFFVVVIFTACAASFARWGRRPPSPRVRWLALPVACLALLAVHFNARNLQTFPEWGAHSDYASFNAAPACLVRAAQFIRDHGQPADLLQDSRFDPGFVATAVGERQSFVAGGTFGGKSEIVAQRIELVGEMQRRADAQTLKSWARANHIGWYLMHPEDSTGWDARFLDQAVYRCDGYRVFRFT